MILYQVGGPCCVFIEEPLQAKLSFPLLVVTQPSYFLQALSKAEYSLCGDNCVVPGYRLLSWRLLMKKIGEKKGREYILKMQNVYFFFRISKQALEEGESGWLRVSSCVMRRCLCQNLAERQRGCPQPGAWGARQKASLHQRAPGIPYLAALSILCLPRSTPRPVVGCSNSRKVSPPSQVLLSAVPHTSLSLPCCFVPCVRASVSSGVGAGRAAGARASSPPTPPGSSILCARGRQSLQGPRFPTCSHGSWESVRNL